MLISALVCTVIGLALLIAALATGMLSLAWVCIGVCVLGFIFLILDIAKNHQKKDNKKELSDADAPADSIDGTDNSSNSSGFSTSGDAEATAGTVGNSTNS